MRGILVKEHSLYILKLRMNKSKENFSVIHPLIIKVRN